MSEPALARFGTAATLASASAAAFYAAMRVVESRVGTEPDWARVVHSEHAGYVWRALCAGYGGGMVGLCAWLVARRDPARAARVAGWSVVVAAVLILAQGLFVP